MKESLNESDYLSGSGNMHLMRRRWFWTRAARDIVRFIGWKTACLILAMLIVLFILQLQYSDGPWSPIGV